MTAPADQDGIMFEKHNSAADDLVTEEIITEVAARIWNNRGASAIDTAEAILRAVAPLIAARAIARHYDDLAADSREKLERAAASRARGEKTTKAPGEIDWSAMDKD
jgi:hypothetical protein